MWEIYDDLCFFFFQAEDGIRDLTVTGVQTCALPILASQSRPPSLPSLNGNTLVLAAKAFPKAGSSCSTTNTELWSGPPRLTSIRHSEIGRASCRERV